jgi:hypothetical protein
MKKPIYRKLASPARPLTSIKRDPVEGSLNWNVAGTRLADRRKPSIRVVDQRSSQVVNRKVINLTEGASDTSQREMSPSTLARALGGRAERRQVYAPGPGHSPGDRSLSILVSPNAPDGFFIIKSFAGDDTHKCRRYVLSKWEEYQAKNREVVEHYLYPKEDGTPFGRVTRFHPKHFFQSHWNGSSFVAGAPSGPPVPYNLPGLAPSPISEPVFIVEGEKGANRLIQLGLTATTNTGGALNWKSVLNRYFHNRCVIILPDNDEKGQKHGIKVARELLPIAASVRVVTLDGLPPKGDVSGWLDADPANTKEGLLDYCTKAPLWADDAPTALLDRSSYKP